jgi:hypothetical protein
MRTTLSRLAVVIAIVAGTGVAVASRAEADDPQVQVVTCRGEGPTAEILRCVKVMYSAGYQAYWVESGIIDKPGGQDYFVSVDTTIIWNDGAPIAFNDADGWGGWWPDGDSGNSRVFTCDGAQHVVRGDAEFEWRRADNGATTPERFSTPAVLVC